mgnify:FL=1|jgi:hypothetical protein
MNIFKKFIPLCLCLSMICTLFCFQTVEGAIAYDETISNGSFSDFQQALLNAKNKGTANHIYKIHITKDLRINQSVGIYSNTMIVVDKNVKIIRNLPAGDGGTTFRVGKPGSSASGYYYRNITIQGGIWDGNVRSKDTGFCTFKVNHSQNVKFLNMTIQNDLEGHMIEAGAVNGLTISRVNFKNHKCYFKAHKNKNDYYEHEEALQLDVNLYETTAIGKYDKYQNKNVTVDRCNFTNLGRGIGSHNSIDGCYFTNMKFTNNTFKNIKSYAIGAINYRNSKIQNNKILNCGSGILFVNSKPNYTGYTGTYVVNNWNLKVNTSKDNSIISGNTITINRPKSKDSRALYINGNKISKPAIYKKGLNSANRLSGYQGYLKGDHRINGLTITKNNITVKNMTAVFYKGIRNSTFSNNNITFNGNQKSDHYGLTMDSVPDQPNENVTVNGNKIKNFNGGILCKNSKKVTFKNTTVYNSYKQHIYLEGVNVTFVGCSLDKAKTKHGIASKNSKITLKNTNITNAKEFGLYSYNCSGKVTGGKIANCGKYGIGAYKKGISYSKVKFSNNGANGKCNYYRG